MSEGYSVDGGSMSVMRRENSAGTGSASVTVHGSSLGLVAYTGMVRSGETGCEGTEWESETSVRCHFGSAAGSSRRISVTLGLVLSSVSLSGSIDLPHLSMHFQANTAQTGSASVTIVGAGIGVFSLSQAARRGHSSCEATEWVSFSSIRCLAGQSYGRSFSAVVTAGQGSGSITRAFTADDSYIYLSAVNAGVNITMDGYRSNRMTDSTVMITLIGLGFGPFRLTQIGRLGDTGCESTTWISESSVSCKVTTRSGATLGTSLTLGINSEVAQTSEAISFDASSISSARQVNNAVTGSASLTLSGAGLGMVSLTAMGRSGHTGCEGTEWESETSVRCLMGHGARGTRRVAMTAGERSGSMSEGYSVDGGSMSVTQGYNTAGMGSTTMTVHGAHGGS